MFTALNFFDFIIDPLSWVAIFLVIGLFVAHKTTDNFSKIGGFHYNKPKTGWIWLALLTLIIQSFEIIPNSLLRRLETKYSSPDLRNNDFEGIVILGGALENAEVWQERDQPQLNSAAERMTEVIPLIQKNPKWKIIFTGGDSTILGNSRPEAELAKIFFLSMLSDDNRIIYESKSRNTYENALLSGVLANVDPKKKWLLLTSASHMPRAMATFSKAGWNVTAYPVDYKGSTNPKWTSFSIINSAKKLKIALHEWIGLMVYELMGRA